MSVGPRGLLWKVGLGVGPAGQTLPPPPPPAPHEVLSHQILFSEMVHNTTGRTRRGGALEGGALGGGAGGRGGRGSGDRSGGAQGPGLWRGLWRELRGALGLLQSGSPRLPAGVAAAAAAAWSGSHKAPPRARDPSTNSERGSQGVSGSLAPFTAGTSQLCLLLSDPFPALLTCGPECHLPRRLIQAQGLKSHQPPQGQAAGQREGAWHCQRPGCAGVTTPATCPIVFWENPSQACWQPCSQGHPWLSPSAGA